MVILVVCLCVRLRHVKAPRLTWRTTMPIRPVQEPSDSLVPKVLSGDSVYSGLDHRICSIKNNVYCIMKYDTIYSIALTENEKTSTAARQTSQKVMFVMLYNIHCTSALR